MTTPCFEVYDPKSRNVLTTKPTREEAEALVAYIGDTDLVVTEGECDDDGEPAA